MAAIALHDRFQKGGGCWAGPKRLAAMVRCDLKRQSTSTGKLLKLGYIQLIPNPRDRRRRAYQIQYSALDQRAFANDGDGLTAPYFSCISARAIGDERLHRRDLSVLGAVSIFDMLAERRGCREARERIAEIASCTPTHTSDCLTRLTRLGYLERLRDPHDGRRKVYIVLYTTADYDASRLKEGPAARNENRSRAGNRSDDSSLDRSEDTFLDRSRSAHDFGPEATRQTTAASTQSRTKRFEKIIEEKGIEGDAHSRDFGTPRVQSARPPAPASQQPAKLAQASKLNERKEVTAAELDRRTEVVLAAKLGSDGWDIIMRLHEAGAEQLARLLRSTRDGTVTGMDIAEARRAALAERADPEPATDRAAANVARLPITGQGDLFPDLTLANPPATKPRPRRDGLIETKIIEVRRRHRQKVPPELVEVLDQSEIDIKLPPATKAEAKRMSAELRVVHRRFFDALREGVEWAVAERVRMAGCDEAMRLPPGTYARDRAPAGRWKRRSRASAA